MAVRSAFEMGGVDVAPGTRQTVQLPLGVLSNHTPMALPVQVVHGRREGPVLFVSAAVHGDEIIGVEIVRRLLRQPALKQLRGTLIAVPIVNAFGFINHSRYLPDRRDLNRCFPGSGDGSFAGRLAHLFLSEVVARADLGIDLHSAAIHRTNLPQIRVSPSKPETMDLALAFGAPVVITSKLRDGSLREAAKEKGVDVLLYEAGEGLRFDEMAIRTGVAGILRIMHGLGMVARRAIAPARATSILSSKSSWLRAPEGGILRAYKGIGAMAEKGEVVGVISDPFGETDIEIEAGEPGLVIGRTNLPIVNQGDALFHIARVRKPDTAEARIGALAEQLGEAAIFDEDEII
ncbi:succinylglutamate desuccinylase/aspartoacylase family protein [Tepidicaulis marinus]|nr:succinylglutamate desuccinylase/aspartoacylase family protein [Tepidicaulis marinus]